MMIAGYLWPFYAKRFPVHLYGENIETKKALRPNLGIQHWGRKVYQVCSNDDPRMSSNFLRHGQISVLKLLWQYWKNVAGICRQAMAVLIR